MASKRDLAVNDLSRYEKSSQRLVLEEYSSCEVPAGCGGGILRWIDPLEALPLTFYLWTTGESEVWLDGAPSKSSRIDARAGSHVLAIHVVPKDGARPQLALGLRYSDEKDPKGTFEPARSRSIGRKIEILSGAGAALVATSKKPAGDAWTQPAFDDSGWTVLARAEPVTREGQRDWHLDTVRKSGARVVGAPFQRGQLWVRCCFELSLGGAR